MGTHTHTHTHTHTNTQTHTHTHTHTSPTRTGPCTLNAVGLLSSDVETRGLPPLAPPPRVCGEVYLTLPYLLPSPPPPCGLLGTSFSIRLALPFRIVPFALHSVTSMAVRLLLGGALDTVASTSTSLSPSPSPPSPVLRF